MNTVALEARGICKRYGARDALRGVDFVVGVGRMHGLLGPNGAGKTTLLRVLLGLVRADRGTISLLGVPFAFDSGPVPDRVAGFADAPRFYPYLSGRQNLELMMRLDGSSGGAVAAADVLEAVDLESGGDVAVRAYSAGMRQRLGLAAALVRRPRLLLVDEPTSSLDPAGASAIQNVMRRLVAAGTTVVLSSHDMIEVEELCETITILHKGSVVFDGEVDHLRGCAPVDVHVIRTSDDVAAFDLAASCCGLAASHRQGTAGFEISGNVECIDRYVLELGRAGIAVRGLERRASSLEAVFLRLTSS